MERKEREERRENIVIKGIKMKDGNQEESVKEVLGVIGVEVDIKKNEERGEGGGERGERWNSGSKTW